MPTVHVQRGANGKVSFFDARAVGRENGQWCLSKFVTDQEGVPLTNEFEVKWSIHPKGDKRAEWSQGTVGSGLVIALKGKIRIYFRPDGPDKETFANLHPGEAVFWENTVAHRWEVLEDGTEIITCRTTK
jgi:hypothetical protein